MTPTTKTAFVNATNPLKSAKYLFITVCWRFRKHSIQSAGVDVPHGHGAIRRCRQRDLAAERHRHRSHHVTVILQGNRTDSVARLTILDNTHSTDHKAEERFGQCKVPHDDALVRSSRDPNQAVRGYAQTSNTLSVALCGNERG